MAPFYCDEADRPLPFHHAMPLTLGVDYAGRLSSPREVTMRVNSVTMGLDDCIIEGDLPPDDDDGDEP